MGEEEGEERLMDEITLLLMISAAANGMKLVVEEADDKCLMA